MREGDGGWVVGQVGERVLGGLKGNGYGLDDG